MILRILQARAGSSRLPGKVLRPLLGVPMLARQIERLKRSARLDQLVVATSDQADDLAIAALCAELDVPCYRGPLDDVLQRPFILVGALAVLLLLPLVYMAAAAVLFQVGGDWPNEVRASALMMILGIAISIGAFYWGSSNKPSVPGK